MYSEKLSRTLEKEGIIRVLLDFIGSKRQLLTSPCDTHYKEYSHPQEANNRGSGIETARFW